MGDKPGTPADQAQTYLRERLIAGALGTSRTPVRTAMRWLVSEGLLQFRPNYGTFVGNW